MATAPFDIRKETLELIEERRRVQPKPELTPPPPRLAAVPDAFRPVIEGAASRHKVPADELALLARQESNFNPNAVNKESGAYGMFQQYPPAHPNFRQVPDPAYQADYAAARYAENMQKYGGDLEKSTTAWFGGQGTIDKAIARGGEQWQLALPPKTARYNQETNEKRGAPNGATPDPKPISISAPNGSATPDQTVIPSTPYVPSLPEPPRAPVPAKASDPKLIAELTAEATREHHDSKAGRLRTAASSFTEAVGAGIAAIPEAFSEIRAGVQQAAGGAPIEGKARDQQRGRIIGAAIRQAFDQPINPEYANEFWASKVPAGFGSTVTFLAGGIAGRALATGSRAAKIAGGFLGAAPMGALTQGALGADDAAAHDADAATRWNAFLLNAGLGTSEALPIGRVLNRLDKGSGGHLSRIFTEGLKGSFEEALQEGMQNAGSNAIAAALYDADRALLEEVPEGTAVGGVVGFTLSALATALGGRKAGDTGLPPGPAERAAAAAGPQAAPTPASGTPPTEPPPGGPAEPKARPAPEAISGDTQFGPDPDAQPPAAEAPPVRPEAAAQEPKIEYPLTDSEGKKYRHWVSGGLIHDDRETVVATGGEPRVYPKETPDVEQSGQQRPAAPDQPGGLAQGQGQPAPAVDADGPPPAGPAAGGAAAGEPDRPQVTQPPTQEKPNEGIETEIPAQGQQQPEGRQEGPTDALTQPPRPADAAGQGPVLTEQPREPTNPANVQRVVGAHGTRVDTEYEVVDISSLQAASGELQPRSRATDPGYEAQVHKIFNEFEPAKLGRSPEADKGSLIVGPDNIIESGNGRRQALDRVFAESPEKAAAYKAMIEKEGFKTEGIKNPVLIRRRLSAMSGDQRKAWVKEANESGMAALTSSERARMDRDVITPALLRSYNPDADIGSAGNQKFISEFAAAAGADPREFFQDGMLTQQGSARIKGAMLSKAYGGTPASDAIVRDVVTNLDPEIGKQLADNLTAYAPQFLELNSRVTDGQADPSAAKAGEKVAAAVQYINAERFAGRNPLGNLAQVDLITGARDPDVTAIVKAMLNEQGNAIRGKKVIGDFLQNLTQNLRAPERVQLSEAISRAVQQANGTYVPPSQGGLFNLPLPPAAGAAPTTETPPPLTGQIPGISPEQPGVPETPGIPPVTGTGLTQPPGPLADDDLSKLFDDAAADVNTQAQQAATSKQNDLPQPTEAQKEAGNYTKGHIDPALTQGLNVTIETPAGAARTGTNKDGSTWNVQMQNHYGYIKRTEGADGEQIDVTVGPQPSNAELPIVVIDQGKPDGSGFDEHKVMLGFADSPAALAAYRGMFEKGHGQKMVDNMVGLREFTPDQFKEWLKTSDKKKPASPQGGAAVTPPAQPPPLPGGNEPTPPSVKTGFRRTVFRGSGRTDRGSAYNPLQPDAPPILGEGQYFAFDRKTAEGFGPDVEERELELANPLTITTDDQWRALAREAGWPYPNPTGLPTEQQREITGRMNALAKSKGHDGIVVDFPDITADITPDGRSIKLLRNVFGSPQAVSFAAPEQQPAAPAAGETPDLTAARTADPANMEGDVSKALEAGDRVFVTHEQDETPVEIKSVADIKGYAAEQIHILPKAGAGATPPVAPPAADKPAKVTKQQTREGERETYRTALTLQAVIEAANADDFRQVAEKAVEKWLADEIAKADPDRAAMLRTINLPDKFYESLQVEAKRIFKKQELDRARDPLVYEAALKEAMEGSDATTDEQAAALRAGFDHALAGKTKSTIAGEHIDMRHKGYQAGIDWRETDEGNAWYTGKRRAKLADTGADLRRWFDKAKKKIDDADKTDIQKTWESIEDSVSLGNLLNPPLGPNATHGLRALINELRDDLYTFKEHGKRSFFSHHVWSGTKAWSDILKSADNEKDIKRMLEEASKYVDTIGGLAEALAGAETVRTAAERIGRRYNYSGVWEGYEAPTPYDAAENKKRHEALNRLMRGYSQSFYPDSHRIRRLITNENVEPKPSQRNVPLIPPKLDRVERKGVPDHRGGKDITPQQFKDTFGFKDIGLGGWVDATGGQDHLNYAYDAFMDLAQLLGIKPTDISLGGTLYFTVGALGQGKHAAHYQPQQPHPAGGTVPVINVTKTKGDGTVAHEWTHALDYALRTHLYSGDSNVPAIVRVVNALSSAPVDYDAFWEDKIRLFLSGTVYWSGDKRLDKRKAAERALNGTYYKAPSSAYFQEAERLDKGGTKVYWANGRELLARASEAWMFDQLDEQGRPEAPRAITREQADEIFKAAGIATTKTTDYDLPMSDPRRGQQYIKSLHKWGSQGEEPIDPATLTGEPAEAWAAAQRNFETPRVTGKRNTYLVNPWVADGVTTAKTGYRGTPYPMGEERKAFAEVFGQLFKEIEWTAKGPKIADDALAALDPQAKFEAAKQRTRERLDEIIEIYEAEQKAKAVAKQLEAEEKKRVAEEAKRAAEEAARQAAATPPQDPMGPLGEDELSNIFDDAASAEREAEQENPESNGLGEQPDTEAPPAAPSAAGGFTSPPSQEGDAPATGAQPAPTEAEQKSAAALIAEAAKLGVKGADEALTGLAKLFGGNKLSAFPSFDEKTYEQAKPHFEAALQAFQAAGKSLKEFFAMLIRQFGESIKPYAIRFAKERNLDVNLGQGASPSMNLAQQVREKISALEPLTMTWLIDAADKAFGGTMGAGKYTVKDMYDAMEAGVNLWLRSAFTRGNIDPNMAAVMRDIGNLKSITATLPTQTKRTPEMEEYQQFSTPPAYAYVVNWLANIKSGETVLEPSAGVGGLAVFAEARGADLILNELSKRRGDLLRGLFPKARVFAEDGAQLNDILPADITPSVVVMNPPFSATAGRVEGQRNSMNGAKHIEQALARLAEGGRLVAIVGESMAEGKPQFKEWWEKIYATYNVRANVGVNGAGYVKYGTTFNNQILVIDKTGPTASDEITGTMLDIADVPALLEEVRNGRSAATQPGQISQPGSSESGEPETPETGEPGSGEPPLSQPGETGGGKAGRPGGTGAVGGRPGGARPPGSGQGGGVAGPRGGRPGVPGATGGSGQGDTGTGGSTDAGRPTEQPDGTRIGAAETKVEGDLTESVFDSYRPRITVEGGQPHGAKLVESAAMASVQSPAPTYTPNLPKEIIESGAISLPQLEFVAYAGQAHEGPRLPNGARRGILTGDGTGVGKTREIIGVIMDNWRRGRRKAIVISANNKLFDGFGAEMKAMGFNAPVHQLKGYGKLTMKDGILFTTYDTLKQDRGEAPKPVDGKPPKAIDPSEFRARLPQIMDWLGKDFDGVIFYDEAHKMANNQAEKGARGSKPTSGNAEIGIKLQDELPNARVAYASATAATEVRNLGYLNRLGLWGERTAFANVRDFIARIGTAGVSAMEVVARDMKALGMYLARSISFDGVKFEQVTHELTPTQVEVYNEASKAWETIRTQLLDALEVTGQADVKGAKGRINSMFYGYQQRFFNQLMLALQMPSVIEKMQADLADPNGPAVVMQLVNTNEAGQERKVSAANLDDDGVAPDEADLEFGPMDMAIEYITTKFPTAKYEQVGEDDKGKPIMVPAQDSEGNAVHSAEAIEIRTKLLETLNALKQSTAIPGNPLDLVIDAFGTDVVGEGTGRKRRFIKQREGDSYTMVEQKRGNKASKADLAAFQNDEKRVFIFSGAMDTGQSFHASLKEKNQRLRRHYIVQPGWKADSVMQALGRTHRTFQKQPPEYVLVTTDVKAQKRFISSIARRLDQLGALTKGERKTTSKGDDGRGLFSAEDNLESPYAVAAQASFWQDLYNPQLGIENLDFAVLAQRMDLNLIDQSTGSFNARAIPPMTKFLNRTLGLDIQTQNAVYDAFYSRLEMIVQAAKDNDTYDHGLETLRAIETNVVHEEVVHTDERTGATTRYVKLEQLKETSLNTWQEVRERAAAVRGALSGYYRDNQTGNVFMLVNRGRTVNAKGVVYTRGERWDVVGPPRPVENLETVESGGGVLYQETEGPTFELVNSTAEAEQLGQMQFPGYYMRDFIKHFNEEGEAAMRGRVNDSFPETGYRSEFREAGMKFADYVVANATTGVHKRRGTRYSTLAKTHDSVDAEAAWNEAYEKAPRTKKETVHMITGVVLPIWDRFGDLRTRVARVQTVDGERLLGRVLKESELAKTLKNLGINKAAKLSPAEIMRYVHGEGRVATLGNGWVLRRALVSGEQRLEIKKVIGGEFTSGESRLLIEQGAFQEKIQWSNRMFIPTADDSVLARILADKPVADLSGEALSQRAAPVDQTETEAFKRWFGSSEVVDADGKPLVVHHGTDADVSEFTDTTEHYSAFKAKYGISGLHFFTSDAPAASRYADRFEEDKGVVYPAYLALKNPLVVDADGSRFDEIPSYALGEDASAERIGRYAIEHGYDGVIIRNVEDHSDGLPHGPIDVYIAFKSEQIKSAVGNSGAFDPSNPNIVAQREPLDGGGIIDRDGPPMRGEGTIETAADLFHLQGMGRVPNNENVDYLGWTQEMTADEFLALAPKGDIDQKKVARFKKMAEDGAYFGIPFIEPSWNEETNQWEVEGTAHEGRHRMRAARELLGKDAKIPVHFFPRYGMRARHVTPEMQAAPMVYMGRGVYAQRQKTPFADVLENLHDVPPKAGSLSRSQVREAIADLLAPVQNMVDLEISQIADYRAPTSVGLHWMGSNRVKMVADKLQGPEQARKTFLHEVYGHLAMERYNDLGALVDRVIRLKPVGAAGPQAARIAEIWRDVEVRYASEPLEIQGQEVIAVMAEEGIDHSIIRTLIAAFRDILRKLGVKIELSDADLRAMIAASARQLNRDNTRTQALKNEFRAKGYAVRQEGDERADRIVSQREGPATPQQAQAATIKAVKDGFSVDSIFRLPFRLLGLLNDRNEFALGAAASKRVERIIIEAKFGKDGPFAWLNPALERARWGLLDKYGVPESVRKQSEAALSRKRGLLAEGLAFAKEITQMTDSLEEATVIQNMLEGQVIDEEQFGALPVAIRAAIEKLSLTAVDLGLISRESYERNRGTYLHRVYKSTELSQYDGSVSKWLSNLVSGRRHRIKGNELKGRGIFWEVTQDRLLRDLDPTDTNLPGRGVRKEKGKPDTSFLGRKFRVLDVTKTPGEGQPEFPSMEPASQRERVVKRIYWPLETDLPKQYADAVDRGTFEIRRIDGGKYVLWRDFTEAERTQMGQILDARYTVAKTFQLFAQDISSGEYFRNLSKNPEATWQAEGPPPAATIADAKDSMVAWIGYEWIKVPTATISETGGKKKWGELAGKYVRVEVWKDLQEYDRMNKSGPWQKILDQWKLNKTARNPVVHMNNFISNLLLADLIDVRWRDVLEGYDAYVKKGEIYQLADKHGALGSGYIDAEMHAHLKGILAEISRESRAGAFKGVLGKMQFFERFANIASRAAAKVGQGDDFMIRAYGAMDDIFKMGAFIRNMRKGMDPDEAARVARDEFLNYDVRAPWINAARRSVLPFLAYTYRAVPVIADAIMRRPWKLAKYALLAEVANVLAYAISGGDEDDEREHLMEQDRGHTWMGGAPYMMRLPWNDEHGRAKFLDIRRWIPSGDVFDQNQNMTLPIPAWMQFGGPLVLASEIVLNRAAFTGQDIVNPMTDDLGDKAGKWAQHGWRSWMPSAPWIYDSWYYDKIKKSVGGKDVLGRPYSTVDAVASSAGVKIRAVDPKLNAKYLNDEYKRTLSALRSEIRAAERARSRNLIDADELEAVREETLEKMRRLGENKAAEQ